MVKLWLLHRLGAGTTRMCAGIVSVAKAISIESQMADYSNSLYQQLEEETGVNTGTCYDSETPVTLKKKS